MKNRPLRTAVTVFLMLVMILNVSLPAFGTVETPKLSTDSGTLLSPGDLNADGKVDLSDVVLLLQHVLFPDLYPLAGSDTGTEEDRYVYKHVVILGVDGGGTGFREADTPNLDRIFENGSVTYKAQCMFPSISGQCWGSMLHGVGPEQHGCTNGSTTPYSNPMYPSIFSVVRDSDPGCSMASFNNWTVINQGIIEANLGIFMDSGGDDALTDKIVAYLEKNQPKLMFVQFDSVDAAGHSWGSASQQYLEYISHIDTLIGRIYDKMAETGMMDDTLLIVAPDHGHKPEGGHGGSSDEEMTVMIAVAGKTVVKGEMGEADLRDIASISLYALGLEQPDTYTGRVPSGVFPGVEATERHEYKPQNIEGYVHEGDPTPAEGSGKTLFDFMGSDSILMYMPLDDDTSDKVGTHTTTEKDKLYFVEGYYGKGCDIVDGALLTDYNPGMNSFSVSCWMKVTRAMTGGEDPCIFSNKNWMSGSNTGFVMSYRKDDIKFNLGDGSARMDQTFMVPSNMAGRWVPVIFTVDRNAGTVALSLDFGEFQICHLPSELKNVSFDGIGCITFGQDGTGAYNVPFPAILDELVIYNRALTSEDVAKLREYYQADTVS